MAETKELQVKEKQEVATPAEHTKPGLIFTPAVDIYENDNEIILLADMPGVSTDDITIDLKDGVLTITGDVKPWENEDESDVLVEFDIGKYYRQFNLSEAIHQEKIEAKFTDGVLKLTLPKVAKAVPRKITINNG
ncbi:MAG: Hsp20/alpha crystallin family protein [Desulfamplus sp.]|nr:Hsp20/alpha crystallin family protein [Desulfamplus sp.]